MLKTFFVPPHLRQSSVDYGAITAELLTALAQSLRQPAIGFGKESKEWRRHAITAWDRLAREWESWTFPEAEALLDQLEAGTRMSRPVLRESVANHFRVITGTELREWLSEVHEVRSNDPDKRPYPELAFVVAAGNIPGVAILPVVQMSLLGIPTLIKSASEEPHLMPLLLESLARHDARVAARTLALCWSRAHADATRAAVAAAPALVAFGDDETMDRLRPAAGVDYVAMGDRFSLEMVQASTLKLRTLRKLVYDYLMFDGKGCLSPQAVLVIAPEWREVEQLAHHVAGVLAEENEQWPAGNWSPEEKARIQSWRGAWQARRAAGETVTLIAPEDTAWTVVAAPHLDLSVRVAHRFVRLWWVRSVEQAMTALAEYRDKLHAFAVDLEEEDRDRLVFDADEQTDLLGRLITAPGELQRPIFSWMEISKAWFELVHGVPL